MKPSNSLWQSSIFHFGLQCHFNHEKLENDFYGYFMIIINILYLGFSETPNIWFAYFLKKHFLTMKYFKNTEKC